MKTEHEYKIFLVEKFSTGEIQLLLKGEMIGRAFFFHDESSGDDIALQSIRVDERYRKKGYGSIIMEYLLDLCLTRGVGLQISSIPEPDISETGQDDPGVFFQKFFRKISIEMTRTSSDFSWKRYYRLTIRLDEIIDRRYPEEYSSSKLIGYRFLAWHKYNLDEKEVSQEWFKPKHYIALGKGNPLAAIDTVEEEFKSIPQKRPDDTNDTEDDLHPLEDDEETDKIIDNIIHEEDDETSEPNRCQQITRCIFGLFNLRFPSNFTTPPREPSPPSDTEYKRH